MSGKSGRRYADRHVCETISDRNVERVKALGDGIAVQDRCPSLRECWACMHTGGLPVNRGYGAWGVIASHSEYPLGAWRDTEDYAYLRGPAARTFDRF